MTICGTDEYMAPEMLFDEDFSYPADMFSFGMVLLEILTRQKVGDEGFARRTPAKLFALEEKDVLELIPSDAPSSLVNLATQCLGYEPDDRPSATTAKEWLLDLLSELPPDKCPIPNIMEAPHVPDPVEEEDSAPAPNERNAPVTRHDSGIVRKSSLSNWGMAQSAASGHGKVASRKGSLQRLASFARRGSFSPTQLSGSGVINLGDTTGTATANLLSDTGSPIPSKMGYLHIKNQGLGFRNWKKRWFVLKGSELTCYKENGLIESVDLTGCTIVRGKANRFQVSTSRTQYASPCIKWDSYLHAPILLHLRLYVWMLERRGGSACMGAMSWNSPVLTLPVWSHG
jgi:serine/threonine protein kinase